MSNADSRMMKAELKKALLLLNFMAIHFDFATSQMVYCFNKRRMMNLCEHKAFLKINGF